MAFSFCGSVVKVMFAHSYSKNSREHAEGGSYALLKSSVFSRRRNVATDSVGHRGVMPAEFHVAGPATAKLRES